MAPSAAASALLRLAVEQTRSAARRGRSRICLSNACTNARRGHGRDEAAARVAARRSRPRPPTKSLPGARPRPCRLPGSSATTRRVAGEAERARAPRRDRRPAGSDRPADVRRTPPARRAVRRTRSRTAAGTARGRRSAPMVRTRPCRQAHTCGLTYCTVLQAGAPSGACARPQIELRRRRCRRTRRAARREARSSVRAQPQQPRQVPQHLGQAHDGELVRRGPGLAARRRSSSGPATPKQLHARARARAAPRSGPRRA